MTWVFVCDERRRFLFVDVSAFFTPGICMMGTPNSLSSDGAESSELLPSGWTTTSYSGILPFPLSDFGLGHDMLSSRGGSCGPISSIELGLSFGGGLGRVSVHLLLDWLGWSRIGLIPRCRFVENDVATYPNRSGRRVEALIRLFRGQVSYEDTFFRRRVGLLSTFVRDAYMRNASEHLEVREDGLPSNEDLVWS